MSTRTYTPSNEPKVVVNSETEGTEIRIDPVPAEAAGKYAEDLSFLNEEVEVMLQPSSNPADSTRIVGPISVNGKGIWIPRGEWVKMRRKYLGVLLSAHTDSWTFTATPTGDGGSKNQQYAVQSSRYSVAGIRDQNPKGEGWLRQLQQQRF
jgi:hypothetical protein